MNLLNDKKFKEHMGCAFIWCFQLYEEPLKRQKSKNKNILISRGTSVSVGIVELTKLYRILLLFII